MSSPANTNANGNGNGSRKKKGNGRKNKNGNKGRQNRDGFQNAYAALSQAAKTEADIVARYESNKKRMKNQLASEFRKEREAKEAAKYAQYATKGDVGKLAASFHKWVDNTNDLTKNITSAIATFDVEDGKLVTHMQVSFRITMKGNASETYGIEYGKNRVEMRGNRTKVNSKVLRAAWQRAGAVKQKTIERLLVELADLEKMPAAE